MTRKEMDTIGMIVDRAQELKLTGKRDRISIFMDIEATHSAIGLRLDGLLAADDFNFIHDVSGIQANLNRDTLKMENYFLPRFAR